MKIYCYNSGCGDAFRIEFVGQSGDTRHILIDGGHSRTYRNVLAAELARIASSKQRIDLCVVSHIHDDHIGGVETYINAVQADRAVDLVDQWWFNAPRIPRVAPQNSTIASEAKSIGQSDIIAGYLKSKDLLVKSSITSDSKPFILDGMELTVLSPSKSKLKMLVDKYSDPKVTIEPHEDFQVTEAVARKSRDYHIRIEEFDFTNWKEDQNPENGGSIVVLTKYKGKQILWLADAHPSVVTNSLKSLGYSKEYPLECDFVKIAHHGSLGNNSVELYQLISCDNYILSVDGYNLHGLPSKACLVNIITSSSRNRWNRCNFFLTCDDHPLRTIFNVDGDDVFERYNFRMIFPSNEAIVELDMD